MTATPADLAWMRRALDLSQLCPPASTAYNVGAVVVNHNTEIATGFSRETDNKVHAEESAFAKLTGVDLRGATIYSTLEPCSQRASRPSTCTQLILDSGIRRVVFALREPPLLVNCEAAEILTDAGIEVVEIHELAAEVAAVNAHVIE